MNTVTMKTPFGQTSPVALEARERVARNARKAERLRVQRLLEERPHEARVPEALTARGAGEDPAQRRLGSIAEHVLVVAREGMRDREQLVGRVVRERDLAREPRAQTWVRVEELVHEPRIAGDDHHEPVPVVLHALQQCLDGFGTEVLALVPARKRIRLVDEEDAVERALDHAVRLERGRADVLAHETRAVDLDQMPTLEQPDRSIHLREQPRDGRLPRARIAEEPQVL